MASDKSQKLEPIPPIRKGANSYKPEDIRRWGVQRFLDEVSPKQPFIIPDLGFTEEENQRMDEILKEERDSADHDL